MDTEHLEQTQEAPDNDDLPIQTPPKKKTAKYLVIALLIVLVIAGLGIAVFSYLRSSPQVRHIGKDAIMVARFDMVKALGKSGFKDLKKEEPNEDLLKKLEEINAQALLKDPMSTGLFTLKPAYVFAEYDVKHNAMLGFLVLPIANAQKVHKFLKGIDYGVDVDIKQKDNKYYFDFPKYMDNTGLAWNKSTLIVGTSIPLGENQEEQKSDKINKKVFAYLDQKRSDSIAGNKMFKKDLAKPHAFTCWMNGDLIANISEKGFKKAKDKVKEYREAQKQYRHALSNYYDYMYYGYDDYYAHAPEFVGEELSSVFESVLYEAGYGTNNEIDNGIEMMLDNVSQLKGSSVMAYCDFEKGKIKTGLKTNLSNEFIKRYKDIFANPTPSKNLAKYLPSDNLIGTMVFGINPDIAWKHFGDNIKKTLKTQIDEDEDLAKFIKLLPNSCDGVGLISVNIGTGKDKDPYVSFAVSTKTKSEIKEMIKMFSEKTSFNKKGNVYTHNYQKMGILIEEDAIIITSDYSQYKRSNLGIKASELKKGGETPFGMFLDIAKTLELAEDELPEKAADILAEFTSLSISSIVKNGMINEVSMDITLKDTKKNSLKTLIGMIPDLD